MTNLINPNQRLKRLLPCYLLLLVILIALIGCDQNKVGSTEDSAQSHLPKNLVSFNDARKGFKTNLTRKDKGTDAPPAQPADTLKLVTYPSLAGDLSAYISLAPTQEKVHPAIVWVAGGFGNDIGDSAWTPAEPDNDQSAVAFRKAGVITMYPSLRGGNNNPGVREGFLGEVDDVLSATEFLAQQPGVDPQRIYLGGHSTGGTLVLLAAASAPQMYRAVFSFGPVAEIAGYGDELPFDTNNEQEVRLRSPIHWLHNIETPTFVIEGKDNPGNLEDLIQMKAKSKNPRIKFMAIDDKNHFSVLSPVSQFIAKKIAENKELPGVSK